MRRVRAARAGAGSVERDRADLAGEREADGLGLLRRELELALARRAPACSTAARSRGWRSRRARRRCGWRRAARATSTGGRRARRRRRSAPARGRRSRRRGAPRRAAMRASSRSATSSTRPCSASKACCSELACGDEVVAAARAEHGALVGAQAAQPEGEHERQHERDQRDAAGGQRGDARGLGQVVHGRGVYERAGPAAPRRASALVEDGLVLRLVVVGLLLARHRRDADRDASPRRPAAAASSSARLAVALACGAIWSIVSRERDRVAAAGLDLDGDLDVELVVLAAVGELDGERRVGRRR